MSENTSSELLAEVKVADQVVGRLTEFKVTSGSTGPVYTLPVPESAGCLPGRLTLTRVMVFEPLRSAPPAPRNRAERRAAS